MLLGNYSVLLKMPVRFRGGSTTSVEPQVRSNFGTSGPNRNAMYPAQAAAALPKRAVPTGYYPNATWVIPQVAGEIGSGEFISGSGSVSAGNLAGGMNAQASLTGAGEITQAIGQLVISMIATLSGSGDITAADIRGYLNAVATLTGSGSVSATIAALGWINASVSGEGAVSNAQPYATGKLESTIRGYSDLTPEGIRDKIWQATAATFNDAGTMGQKLNSAASGGVDYSALANAVWTHVIEAGLTAEQAMRVYGAVLAGTVSGAGSGTETFVGLDGTTVRVTSVVDATGNRTSVTVNGA